MKRKTLFTHMAPLALYALLTGCGKAPEAPAQTAAKTWNLPVMTATASAPG